MDARAVILLLGLLPALGSAAVYKHVDDQGNVTYTDEPRPGAEVIDPDERSSTYSYTPPSSVSRDTSADPEPGPAYATVRIVQPGSEATVRDNQGLVDVEVALDPPLRDGHTVEFLLDGEPRGEPQASVTRQLTDVHRGEHRVAARVLDASGEILVTSEPVVFYMHQASRLQGGSAARSPNPGGVSFPGN